ncbi:unnamed protein product [Aspergillus oryzae var. brunneus]|uniref:Unnamed protein product n=2 Tax=Aspergillus oryzae TaxID=5062 RepID=A0AAN4YSA0_ASPOZ|nr:unnamed protein product [Aspergillus oryzae]GMG36222.1 unnamed protein product [Aspergillus oryzae]GMG51719.1 unnamed protein product [Aspergillus oryzae var. brunneus]
MNFTPEYEDISPWDMEKKEKKKNDNEFLNSQQPDKYLRVRDPRLPHFPCLRLFAKESIDLIYLIGRPCIFLGVDAVILQLLILDHLQSLNSKITLERILNHPPFYLSHEQEQCNPHSSTDFISCYISLITISHSSIRNQERGYAISQSPAVFSTGPRLAVAKRLP